MGDGQHAEGMGRHAYGPSRCRRPSLWEPDAMLSTDGTPNKSHLISSSVMTSPWEKLPRPTPAIAQLAGNGCRAHGHRRRPFSLDEGFHLTLPANGANPSIVSSRPWATVKRKRVALWPNRKARKAGFVFFNCIAIACRHREWSTEAAPVVKVAEPSSRVAKRTALRYHRTPSRVVAQRCPNFPGLMFSIMSPFAKARNSDDSGFQATCLLFACLPPK